MCLFGHPQVYLAILGELRIAATNLYSGTCVAWLLKKKKKVILIPEEIWLGT